MTKLARIAPLVLGVLPVVAAAACYGPTSMRVDVLTDAPCVPGALPRALVFSGTDADALGGTTRCDPAADGQGQTLGDILFAPKDDRTATVKVRVRMGINGQDPSGCVESAPASERAKCVFASRRFTYLEHESRRMGVRLYTACAGVVCDEGKTCVPNDGTRDPCVSDVVACPGGTCGIDGEIPLSTTTPVDAGGDAAAPVDASVDATVDAGPPVGCGTIVPSSSVLTADLVAATLSKAYWIDGGVIKSFDMTTKLLSAATPYTGTLHHVAAAPLSLWWSTLNGNVDAFFELGTPRGQMNSVTAVDAHAAGAIVAAGSGVVTLLPSGGGTNAPLANVGQTVYSVAHDNTYAYVHYAAKIDYFNLQTPSATGNVIPDAIEKLFAAPKVALFSTGGGATIGWIDSIGKPPAPHPLLTIGTLSPAMSADDTHVYWVDASSAPPRIFRTPLASPVNGAVAQPVHTEALGESIVALAPDAAPNGCLYYWVNSGTTHLFKGVAKPVP